VIKPFDLVANTGKLDLMESTMKGCDGVIVPGGFGERAWEDKIWATKLAREMKKPFIGICYGFQVIPV
jgi:CTP synthase